MPLPMEPEEGKQREGIGGSIVYRSASSLFPHYTKKMATKRFLDATQFKLKKKLKKKGLPKYDLPEKNYRLPEE